MKRIVYTIILAAAAMNINAQLVVDSLGRVGIGIETPNAPLYVKASGSSDKTIYCSAQGKEYGIYTINYTNDDNSTYGIYSSVQNNRGKW